MIDVVVLYAESGVASSEDLVHYTLWLVYADLFTTIILIIISILHDLIVD